tara:strand:+ start:2735 stop:3895 length:1161 start_codon:yes stop_codon:yes gene_type:complete
MSDQPKVFCVQGGRLLLPDGNLLETDVIIVDGYIDSIGKTPNSDTPIIKASGNLVLPGVIDLHGDAFERQIMPRAGVSFPLELALGETDRQMLANGITTAFHGITYSWEPGLRSRNTVVELMAAIEQMRFGCDTKCHLRFETYNLAAVEEVLQWLELGKIDLLAFNNHMPSIQRKITSGESLSRFTERTGLNESDFVEMVQHLVDRREEVKGAMIQLAKIAVKNLVPMASHDDETIETRQFYDSLGCGISEFPLTAEATKEANRLGNQIILGAPNVVRGGSHMGSLGISAIETITNGFGDILCSDYFYPALARAPFILATKEILEFVDSWKMVSTNPAKAAGLHDRGEISEGKRADLVIINTAEYHSIEVLATIVKGRIEYKNGWV